jgi:hypothetical protein
MQHEIYLKYKGAGFLSLVPARDLTHEEAKRYGINYLLKSGFYKLAKQPKKKKEGE